jgi:hypothetical protein
MRLYLWAAIKAIEKWVGEYKEDAREEDLSHNALGSALLFLRTYYPYADEESLLRELREGFLETTAISTKMSELVKKRMELLQKLRKELPARSVGSGPSGAGGT